MRGKVAVPVFILITLVVLAGCATAPAAPTDTPAPPTPTQPQRPTLPPSWTPGPAPTQGALATATATPHTPHPAQAADDGRPTLPPSWTPQPFATVTRPPLTGPIATPLPPTITPVVEPTSGFGALQGGRPAGGPPTPARNADYPAACRTFAMSAPTDAVLPLDSDARLAWAAVEGADGYHVWVMNPSFRYAFDQGTTETAITIPASTFIGTGMYAWEVMPVRDGDRMCPSRTGVFTLRRD
ncbi:MAG: hypothetical protein IT323_07325 [Anaerolineae bacterium]|nr:hypothetical protein [Anaerolineae bacterium]